MIFQVNSGQHVLILWKQLVPPEALQNLVESLQSQVGKSGRIAVENVDRLTLSGHHPSTFDIILSGVIPQSPIVHDSELLTEIIRLLKPSGNLVLHEPTSKQEETLLLKTVEKLTSTLKICGFVKISNGTKVELTSSVIQDIQRALKLETNLQLTEIVCSKPEFELGSACQLPLGLTPKTVKVDENAAKVWTLSADDALDEELIDSDLLLDEDDLKKPDPSTLKVCGTTGKRKACKNCSCGLADELNAANIGAVKTAAQASACGNCSLGDAFRCASCPYLGMPPFKPGEKIALSERQLQADI